MLGTDGNNSLTGTNENDRLGVSRADSFVKKNITPNS